MQMNKLLKGIMIIAVIYCFVGINNVTYAEANEISVFFEGQKINFDTPPIMMNNRILVPMRNMFETLGCKITWDPQDKQITATNGQMIYKMRINDHVISATNEYGYSKIISLDVAPTIIKGTTFVPMTLLVRSLSGYYFNFDQNNLKLTITRYDTPRDSSQKTINVVEPPKIEIINDVQTNENQIEEDDTVATRELIYKKINDIRSEGSVGYWSSEYDYNLELTKLQNERQTLQHRLNTLYLDDSFEAQHQKEELRQDIYALDVKINEIQSERSRQLRIENLLNWLNEL